MSRPQTIAKDIIFSFALIMVFLIAVLAIELVPPTGGPVMIVTNPFSERNALEVIAAAHGKILSAGRWPWIAVASNSGDPDFREKLKAAGTLFFLPPLAGACITPSASQGI